jgi:hypothetical protein
MRSAHCAALAGRSQARWLRTRASAGPDTAIAQTAITSPLNACGAGVGRTARRSLDGNSLVAASPVIRAAGQIF